MNRVVKLQNVMTLSTLREQCVITLARYADSKDRRDFNRASAFAKEALERSPLDPVLNLCMGKIMEYLYGRNQKDYFARKAMNCYEVAWMAARLSEETKDLTLTGLYKTSSLPEEYWQPTLSSGVAEENKQARNMSQTQPS